MVRTIVGTLVEVGRGPPAAGVDARACWRRRDRAPRRTDGAGRTGCFWWVDTSSVAADRTLQTCIEPLLTKEPECRLSSSWPGFRQDRPTKRWRVRSNFEQLPAHVAIIMDGNGRWAAQRHLPRVEGHRAGIDSVRDVVETSARLGIDVLTLYAFSVENWKRPRAEVNTLMMLLKRYIRLELEHAAQEQHPVSA